ncbi:hypothetical protein [Halopenitus persicus]|uniref:Phospholipase_D-nuclease N-terminal n=1 Tax=Halopenitus persicus TaxID=1048396 RepID=A0A1H3MCF3_9EURY|nr:hypothetical protein [Halopenitus persicus]QHS16539.1 hypothetical protein GWK26_04880 [haloarchaeon 3A1-DGR]SDY73869.1 hypothetical protein SAMN05216564_10926 [Halopenitus persicus]
MSLLQTVVPGTPELIILLLIAVIPFAVAVVVSGLIYRDAKKRNSGHALAWAVGGFFGGIVVWILYLVVRDEVGPGGAGRGGGRSRV